VVDVEVGVLVGVIVGVLVDGIGVLVAATVLVGVCVGVVADVGARGGGSEVAVAVGGDPHATVRMQAISKIAAQQTRLPIAFPPHPFRRRTAALPTLYHHLGR
jgi:hypothetical protein